jgi:hypothetical protein
MCSDIAPELGHKLNTSEVNMDTNTVDTSKVLPEISEYAKLDKLTNLGN